MPMGSDESSTPAKPPNSRPFSSAATTPPAAPEVLTSTSYSADWAASVQAAFYSGGATPPQAFFPPVWGGQHLYSPYATPITYSPMYAPGAVYAHPSMTQGMSYPDAELGSVKSKGALLKLGEGGKVTPLSGEDESSQSGGSATDGSSDSGNESTADLQENSKKKFRGDDFQEGEGSHLGASTLRKRARKLPVSAPGRTTLSGPLTNLNIGMGIWNPPHAGTSVLKKDDRELKRERRKQSNRESARRSRLRKQQECDELARKVAELNGENNALRMELDQLRKVCKDLEAENQHIAGELSSIRGDSLKQAGDSQPTTSR